jgi:adenylate cyclase
MGVLEDVEGDVGGVLKDAWNIRDGQVVPTTDTVVLAGGGVKLSATFLYADLADSTKLAMWDRRVTARVCKAFLAVSSRLIKASGGEVRSFDGDRVMGVFVGSTKNTSAIKCGLKINYVFGKVLKPRFDAKYEALRNGTHVLGHGTGIDTSEVLAVRGGVRNSNDLIWVGRAPNIAAKLCNLREPPFNTFISGTVYDAATDEAKTSSDGRPMWEERRWTQGPIERVFRSSWTWKP